MRQIVVTATAEDALGRAVTASATAALHDSRPVITETVEIRVDASRLHALADLIERHAAEIRRDLARFMDREDREDRDEERM